MPSNAVSTRYQICFFTILKSSIVLLNANGAKTIQAIVQRQKASPMGGMCPFIPLAITIFTDQSKVANKANNAPLVGLLIY